VEDHPGRRDSGEGRGGVFGVGQIDD
jgi:hypothetical protein